MTCHYVKCSLMIRKSCLCEKSDFVEQQKIMHYPRSERKRDFFPDAPSDLSISPIRQSSIANELFDVDAATLEAEPQRKSDFWAIRIMK